MSIISLIHYIASNSIIFKSELLKINYNLIIILYISTKITIKILSLSLIDKYAN